MWDTYMHIDKILTHKIKKKFKEKSNALFFILFFVLLKECIISLN